MNLLFQSRALLAAGGQLTPPTSTLGSSIGWFSIGAATGNSIVGASSGVSVRVAVFADQPGSLVLYQTDDPGLKGMTFEIVRSSVPGGQATILEYGVTAQYWGFVYTNGPNAQGVMNLLAFGAADLSASILSELRKLNAQALAIRSPEDNGRDDLTRI